MRFWELCISGWILGIVGKVCVKRSAHALFHGIGRYGVEIMDF